MSDTKIIDVWVVWTNTDLTEGRGRQIPLVSCKVKATADRCSKNKGVMGSDATVKKGKAINYKGNFYIMGSIQNPTDNDMAAELKRQEKERALSKAKSLGLSDKEIKSLTTK